MSTAYYFETDGGSAGYIQADSLESARAKFAADHPDIAPERAGIWAPTEFEHPLNPFIREFRSQAVEAAREFSGWDDWVMPVWCSDGKTYRPCCLAETEDMPDGVQAWARDYDQRVRDASIRAAALANEALAALETGDLATAESKAKEAAEEEAQFGDCPAYRPLTITIRDARNSLDE